MLAVLRIAGPRLLDGEQRERLCILANLVEAREAGAPSSEIAPGDRSLELKAIGPRARHIVFLIA